MHTLRTALQEAMHCPGAIGNPFLHLRLGEVLLNLGVVALAWLAGKLLSRPRGAPTWLPLVLPLTVALLPMRAFADMSWLFQVPDSLVLKYTLVELELPLTRTDRTKAWFL